MKLEVAVSSFKRRNDMPPSGFSRRSVKGVLQFVGECYKDLLEEVRSGKHRSYEEAIKFEIRQIDSALAKVHIDGKGNLVEK